jgi:kynurenine formamidase
MVTGIHDIGMPIHNGMWHYRPGWEAGITTIASTARGDASSVYRFNLCSHTGTYIETSQHKLPNDILLDDFGPEAFVCPCAVIATPAGPSQAIGLDAVQTALSGADTALVAGDSLIVTTGWGLRHRDANYLASSPHFEEELVAWLCRQNLHLLGVDIPSIDNRERPIGAVQKLFEANPRMLLLAPLVIDPRQVVAGRYLLAAAPLKIEAVSASLCRPLLLPLATEVPAAD